MLEKLFSKRTSMKRNPDRIWRTRDGEFKGLLEFIGTLDRQTTRILLLAQFTDTFQDIEKQLKTKLLNYRAYTTIFEGHLLRTIEEYQSPDCILLARSLAIPERSPMAGYSNALWNFDIFIFVLEHHPLASYDDRIIRFAQSLPSRSRVCFYESLDGAFFRHHGGMKVSQLVTALGLPDSEYISNPMIDKTIRQSQEKILKRVVNPIITDTADQWFQQNYSADQ